jgi:ubiquinone/menaquinone biosynthesis C-methylase UbiE
MKTEIEKWEREEGVKFLKKIGIKRGHNVLDFGARVGHYSIPAAIAVGKTGLIYAVDKAQAELAELSRKAKRLNLKNVKIVRTNGGVTLDFKDETIDVVLLYDVLHYLREIEREKLYREVLRVLHQDGFLSVYPKHVIEDSPLDQLRELHLDDVKQEIQDSNFRFQKKYCDTISHDDFLNQGCVLNFIRGSVDYKGSE